MTATKTLLAALATAALAAPAMGEPDLTGTWERYPQPGDAPDPVLVSAPIPDPPLKPEYKAPWQANQEKLAARIAEAAAAPTDERIQQEIVLYAARIDVEEELGRLATHIAEFRRVLDKGGAIGKRLDFLCQELNREANTLGSKSVANEMTRISVELKVLIEQMREQVQNIE